MKKQRLVKRLLGLSFVGALALSGQAYASGFQLFEYDGASIGDAGAGAAAIADTASTNFTNAAGLVRIKNPQVVISADQVISQTQFTGTSTNIFLGVPFSQTGTTSGSASAIIPSFHYAAPINDRWYFGFSGTVPFGLDTEYPTQDFQRYSNTLSSIMTFNLSPSLAFKVNDKFSLALGVDAQNMQAKLNSVVGAPGIATALGLSPTTFDTQLLNTASGWGYGWHAGLLYQFTPATRVGLSYRSQVAQRLTGTSTFSGPLAGPAGSLTSNGLAANIRMPSTTMLSIYHCFNPQWAVMASVIYTNWSVIQNITLTGSSVGTTVIPQNFRNTWRYAAGVHYNINSQWGLRFGVGADQTPTNDTNRTLALPEANRTFTAIGAHYQVTRAVGLDLGWTHVFMQNASINSNNGVAKINGSSSNSADVIGLQLTWDIV